MYVNITDLFIFFYSSLPFRFLFANVHIIVCHFDFDRRLHTAYCHYAISESIFFLISSKSFHLKKKKPLHLITFTNIIISMLHGFLISIEYTSAASEWARVFLFVCFFKTKYSVYVFMRYYDVNYNWCVVFHFTHDYDMWNCEQERRKRCKMCTLVPFGATYSRRQNDTFSSKQHQLKKKRFIYRRRRRRRRTERKTEKNEKDIFITRASNFYWHKI